MHDSSQDHDNAKIILVVRCGLVCCMIFITMRKCWVGVKQVTGACKQFMLYMGVRSESRGNVVCSAIDSYLIKAGLHKKLTQKHD